MNDRIERRRETRIVAGVNAYMVVVSGKNESIRSTREKVKIRNISSSGASIVSSTVRPGGIHIMYNDLMLYKNRLEIQLQMGDEEIMTIMGRVVWYDRPDDMTDYLIGVAFDNPVDISPITGE
jgi:hypothetical protein